ncbi:hypothetical protein ACWIUD_04850 [Helicobacter sp. 23-1044]
MQFTQSLPHCVVNEPSVLFPSNRANFVQSHTANISIVPTNNTKIAESTQKPKADSAFCKNHIKKVAFIFLQFSL